MTGLPLDAWLASARDGSWLTRQRIRTYAMLAVGAYACLAVVMLVLGVRGGTGGMGLVAQDFGQVWAAGHAVVVGHALAPYDTAKHMAMLTILFGAKAPNFIFTYPPFVLPVAGALALLPGGIAFVVEQGAELAMYMLAARLILPGRLPMLCALAFPSVAVNLMFGQVGTLTAGLAGCALALLDRRPVMAGVLFGCMAYKPQFGLAIPLALVAGRRWTTCAAASVTVCALVVSSGVAFGWQAWPDFFGSLRVTGGLVLSTGGVAWYRSQSVFAALRLWGAPERAAWVAQGIAAMAACVAVGWGWGRRADPRLQGALLLATGLLCTPYSFEPDMAILAPAAGLLIATGLERGFRPWEATLLASVWGVALVAQLAAHYLLVPLWLLATVALAVLSARRMAAA